MAMTNPYCNVTDDLQSVFKDIENFSGLVTLESWTIVPLMSNAYYKKNVGHIGRVIQGGHINDYIEKTTLADVESNVASFNYSESYDILYIHTSDSAAPSTHTIKVHSYSDWNTFKTVMANRAFQQLEGMLDNKYPRPLPFAAIQYNSKDYDSDIRDAAARLTCINIIRHTKPDSPLIKKLQDLVWNAKEEIGVIWEYSKGLRSFSFECTADQFNGNVKVITRDSSSTGLIHLAGKGDRSTREKISIKIVTGGAVKTATWKYSLDNQASWSSTITTSIQYMYLINDIYLKFTGTFVADDEWEINISGDPEQVTNPGIHSIKMRRY